MPKFWLWIAALGLILAVVPRAPDVVLYNHSPSMPVGLYWRVGTTQPDALLKGTIVTVRAASVAPQMTAARHFDGPKNRFIKHVAATGGDRVCAQGSTLTINKDKPVKRRAAFEGTPRGTGTIPVWSGCRVLAHDEVLLLGEAEDSFDGRYWGPVPATLIEGTWRWIGWPRHLRMAAINICSNISSQALQQNLVCSNVATGN